MSVQTVLGRVPAEQLGRTLTHEHLRLNYSGNYIAPPPQLADYLKGDITLSNVGFVQRYPYSNELNLLFDDEEAVIYDVNLFKKHGGGAIVENTTHGIGRNARFLRLLAQITGVHIIAGTGFYVASSQNKDSLKYTVEEIYNVMKKDLLEGCSEDPTVKCGFLGEVALSYPFSDLGDGFELRSIQATGELQASTKCPVSFHPGRAPESPWEIMRKFTEAGGDDSKCVMSHLERTLVSDAQFLEFADAWKCYLQQDLCGTEVLTYQFAPEVQMPSDAQRVANVKLLVSNGYQERVLLSHDIHTRQRLVKYGGHGYMHILANIIPKMQGAGISDEVIGTITKTNPQRWLSWL